MFTEFLQVKRAFAYLFLSGTLLLVNSCDKKEEKEIIIVTDGGKAISLSTALIPEKATRTSQGVTIFQIKSDNKAIFVSDKPEKYASSGKSYKKIKLPATGVPMAEQDVKNLPETVAAKLK